MPRARRPTANRTDLDRPADPGRILTAPNQEYGKRTAQEQSQRILPIGSTPTAEQPTVSAPATPTAAVAPTPPPAFGPPPGAKHWLDQPGSGGPPTTGLPNSAGPGPEVLTGVGAH